ncbi:unnamed protein product [Urochloa humidicola]
MTRKRTREQSSEEGINGTSTTDEEDNAFIVAPAAPAFPAQVEFLSLYLSMSCYVHHVLYLELTYVYVLRLYSIILLTFNFFYAYTDELLTEYERDRAKRIMRNNQMLQNLGIIPALASILNVSNAKSKQALNMV